MRIDAARCTVCAECVPTCPVGAIVAGEGGRPSWIDPDPCVECGVCVRAGVCPTDAIEAEELAWPRSLRRLFSDPLLVHDGTGVPGRGTEEIKTNEVTGRLRPGHVGVAVELGRPGVSASLAEVEQVAAACAALGIRFEPANPLTRLMVDPSQGSLPPEVRGERVMSALVEMVVVEDRLADVLDAVRAAVAGVDTVASVGVSVRLAGSGERAATAWAARHGLDVSPRGKTNVGLGRLPSPAGGVEA